VDVQLRQTGIIIIFGHSNNLEGARRSVRQETEHSRGESFAPLHSTINKWRIGMPLNASRTQGILRNKGHKGTATDALYNAMECTGVEPANNASTKRKNIQGRKREEQAWNIWKNANKNDSDTAEIDLCCELGSFGLQLPCLPFFLI
jgi:hypothetical protein